MASTGSPRPNRARIGGVNSDVFNQKSFIADGKDDYPHDGFIALGDRYPTATDELGVILGHRAGQRPDALNVVLVRVVNQLRHLGRILLVCRPKRMSP